MRQQPTRREASFGLEEFHWKSRGRAVGLRRPGSPPEPIVKAELDLLFQVAGVLSNLVTGRHRSSAGLESPLRHNEIRKLSGDVHVRQLQRSARKSSTPASSGSARNSLSRSQRGTVVGVAFEL